MAPEYAMHGYLTDKADVFSFGAVALEIVSGKKNTNGGPEELGQPKIRNFSIEVLIKQHIASLNVSVHNLQSRFLMEVCQTLGYS